MATLILTTVGGVVGGPIGAAIGGLIGGAVDARLLAPKGRQGPRLTELAVQTSSYGSPIPKLFGTMRVAGSLIWATDLQETRSSSGGGKGRPSTTAYSYSASFAVLLSARAIHDVGRIWADGKLLRGGAGDWKSTTVFRLHNGGEAQAPDPLIASLEGTLAPAHRGCAYAVFEDLQLADYGNRIPSLTFEVIADPDPVDIGVIANAIGGPVVVAEPELGTLAGFSAYGDSKRGVLETLATASGGWFANDGAGVTMRAATGPAAVVTDAGHAAGTGRGARGVRAIAAVDAAPRRLAISHYDPARDYQAGLQRARRPGAGHREERIELPAAIDAAGAKALAEATLARAETARERRRIALSLADRAIGPGARVAIAGEVGAWRVTGWTLEAMVLTLELARIARTPAPASASPGRVLAAPDRVHGATIVHLFELPSLDAPLAGPRLWVAGAGAGPGWRQAALLFSLDDGAHWRTLGGTGGAATVGVVVTPPGPGPATLIDQASTLVVELAHHEMTLAEADDGALDAGANLALVGDELLQFGTATPLGDTRWRLGRLLRGRRGTEQHAGTQTSGDRFVMIESDRMVPIDLPASAIGAQARVLASSVGDLDGPAEAAATVTGISVRPPAPVHVAVAAMSAGESRVRWTRRSRAGWRWIDGVDAPLVEEREACRVTIVPATGEAREIETVQPEATVLAAELPATVAIRQLGSFGPSAPATVAAA